MQTKQVYRKTDMTIILQHVLLLTLVSFWQLYNNWKHFSERNKQQRCVTYLYDIILAVFSMHSFHSADIQTSEHLGARVHPQTIPKERKRSKINEWNQSTNSHYIHILRIFLSTLLSCFSLTCSDIPICHGDLLQHSRSCVCLPVTWNGGSPTKRRDKKKTCKVNCG